MFFDIFWAFDIFTYFVCNFFLGGGLMWRVDTDEEIYLLGGIGSLHRNRKAMHHRHNLQISLPRRNTLTESPAPLVGFDRRQKRDKRKTESGKRKTFVFRVPLGVRKRNRRQTESRGCLHAMPRCEGGKASVAGLKRKTENFCFSVFACSVKTEPQTSLPRRNKLKGEGLANRQKIGENLSIVAYLRTHCE